MSTEYAEAQPDRSEIDALTGPAVLQFGTNWCGYCIAARNYIDPVLDAAGVRRILAEDGPGRPLGRSFKVKLWPTLIFLRDGVEATRLVRPSSKQAVEDALAQIS